MKQIYFVFSLSIILWGSCLSCAFSQCTTTNLTGNFTQNTSAFLSGIYNVTGTFRIPSGVTVFVQSYSNGGCGKLEVHASKIIIEGTINGDYAGYTGGTGGNGGTTVTSLTGDIVALDNCSNGDYTGQVTVQAGKAGLAGNGIGGGAYGGNGQDGSGPKQQCLNGSDDSGMIGGSGGGGGGCGGSYGGLASDGGDGGNGSNFYQATGINVSTGFVVIGGAGGIGGLAGTSYGTEAGSDIDLGSGGAGAGGGGRSYDIGLIGNKGGAGGGIVKLIAADTIKVTGTIKVNGENGLTGGNAGNGGQSPKCCSDGCDDCGETTLSCGSGGGAGGGGGSGGGIYLETQTMQISQAHLAQKAGTEALED